MSTNTSRRGFGNLQFLSGAAILLAAVAPMTAQSKPSKNVPATPKASATKTATYNFGVPWEEEYGISQGYSVNGVIFMSGQFSHDAQGKFVGEGDIAAQTRQTLSNIDRVLAGFGVTKSNIVEIDIYLTHPKEDSEPCLKVLKQYMGSVRPVATLLGVTALAFPQELVEIRVIAHAD